MSALSWLLVIAGLYYASIVCCEEELDLDSISDGPEFPGIKWYYVPQFVIQNSREESARLLSIQCQSHTLCGMKRLTDPTSTAPLTQYCECPEGEECRRISVIEPMNFTYYRCMDII